MVVTLSLSSSSVPSSVDVGHACRPDWALTPLVTISCLLSLSPLRISLEVGRWHELKSTVHLLDCTFLSKSRGRYHFLESLIHHSNQCDVFRQQDQWHSRSYQTISTVTSPPPLTSALSSIYPNPFLKRLRKSDE